MLFDVSLLVCIAVCSVEFLAKRPAIVSAYFVTTASSRRKAMALMTLATFSDILSEVLRCLLVATRERRIAASWVQVTSWCGTSHCFVDRWCRVSSAFLMMPGVVLIACFSWLRGGIVVGFGVRVHHEGGQSVAFAFSFLDVVAMFLGMIGGP